MANKLLRFDPEKLKSDIAPFEIAIAQCLEMGILKDGRDYQIQLILTTDEDDFIEDEED